MTEAKQQSKTISSLKRLLDLKQKFEHLIPREKLQEIREHLSETLEHAQSTLAHKVDHELKASLKQTADFIHAQKEELELFQKKINSLLKKGTPRKKKATKTKKVTKKKKAPRKLK